MSYLAAAVVVLGALCLLNLGLTFVLIRRVSGKFAQPGRSVGYHVPPPLLSPGSQAPDFAVTTVSGETRSRGGITGSRSLLGFFSPSCPPCQKAIPEFVNYASTISGGPPQVLAVVSGEADGPAESYVRELQEVASVVIEPRRGPAATAFEVSGYPCFYVLDEEGRVEVGARSMQALLAADRA
jgi:thiol-disulfide isomerase/thioredoxin